MLEFFRRIFSQNLSNTMVRSDDALYDQHFDSTLKSCAEQELRDQSTISFHLCEFQPMDESPVGIPVWVLSEEDVQFIATQSEDGTWYRKNDGKLVGLPVGWKPFVPKVR